MSDLGPSDAELQAMAGVADPWVMYLVARRRAVAGADPLGLLGAAASAVIACAAGAGADAQAALDDWAAESQRKVVLSAREGEWDRLLETHDPAVVSLAGEPALACLVPVRRSARGTLLGRLRVYDPGAGDADVDAHVAPGAPAGPAILVANGGLGMSTGKLMAQVGHGAFALWRAAARAGAGDALASWEACGRPVAVAIASGEDFARAAAEARVVIRDAGLTEVARGSQTVALVVSDNPHQQGSGSPDRST